MSLSSPGHPEPPAKDLCPGGKAETLLFLIPALVLGNLICSMAGCSQVWEDIYFVPMARTIPVDDLTAEERIELMGRLWDSLDPALAAPVSPDVGAELDLREEEADSAPGAGVAWSDIKDDLRKKLK